MSSTATALAAELQADGGAGPVRAVRSAGHRRAPARGRGARGGPRSGARAGQQRRARRPPRWQDVTPEFYDERIATNLRHMFFAIQAVAPGMIAAGGGSIINLGSDSWWRAGGGFPVYTTAKAAVHGLTRGMARDLGPHRIRVNTLVPGWTMTERQKRLWVTPERPGARSSPRSACRIRSSRSTSRGWRSSSPRTTPRCARRTTTWWRRDRSRADCPQIDARPANPPHALRKLSRSRHRKSE